MTEQLEPTPEPEQLPAQSLGGLFTLTATAEVIRGDQHDEDPEEDR